MQFSVLLSLRVTQPPWRPECSHMTCCSSVLDCRLQGRGTLENLHFNLQLSYNRTKMGAIVQVICLWWDKRTDLTTVMPWLVSPLNYRVKDSYHKSHTFA